MSRSFTGLLNKSAMSSKLDYVRENHKPLMDEYEETAGKIAEIIGAW